MIKLSLWCKKRNISYTTGYNWFKSGKLPVKAYQSPTGTIMVEDEPKTSCKVTEDKTGRSFIIQLDLDINANNLTGPDQKELLDKINELADLIAEKLSFGVKSKRWIP